ncbi:MAG: hypothetical protein CL678_04695 [Bdellovibrionaceae bacterium]|nr:hypothetical protein [Pseudobdellovibrionaceae bacterium]
MGMKYETNDNRVIAVSAIIFSVIFFVLTATDLFFRKDGVYVQKGDLEAWAALGADSQTLKFKKPWVSSDELVAHGKKLFDMQCATCHGSAGKGDGPASGALNPKPRNFTQASGLKNGRKPAQIYGTLQKGLGTMPSFGSLPKDDLWALAHYVSHFGPDVLKDSNADLKKVGIDPSKEDGGLGGAGSKVLPIDFAIELMSEDS